MMSAEEKIVISALVLYGILATVSIEISGPKGVYEPDCDCSSQKFINITNSSFHHELTPRNSNTTYCPIMHCLWEVYFYRNYTDILQIIIHNGLNISTTLQVIVHDTEQILYDSNVISDSNQESFYTQEENICIVFNSTGINTGGWWSIDLDVISWDDFNKNVQNLILEQDEIIKVFQDEINNLTQLRISSIASESLDVFLMLAPYINTGVYLDNNFYLFDSPYLTNYIGVYSYNPEFSDPGYKWINTTHGILTIFYVGDAMSLGDMQIVYRNQEEHAKNCVSAENIAYVPYSNDPDTLPQNLTYRGGVFGPCIFTLLSPVAVVPSKIPSLNLISIEYYGNEPTRVFRGNNDSLVLFEFEASDAYLWNGVTIYGDLINFILPSNSEINLQFMLDFNLEYVSNSSYYYGNISERKFEDDIHGVFTNPVRAELQDGSLFQSNWTLSKSAISLDGSKLFNVSVLNFNSTFHMISLEIHNESSMICEFNNTTECFNQEFTGFMMRAVWKFDMNSLRLQQYDSFMISYTARHIETTSTSTASTSTTSLLPTKASKNSNNSWLIGAICGAVIIGILIIAVVGYFRMKYTQKRYEQIFDLLKEMRITPEELTSFKEKSDEMFIQPKKLTINYESNLGQGSCSYVYKGHLSGPSPLFLAKRMIETQKFCDCEVAVKAARNFGTGEVEQLYKEIQAMKALGYHENIMCLLGWSMAEEKPCLVFDIAQNDLLKHVRGLAEQVELPYKSFLSILWQITRGMQYIASKSLIHRDLAARNILLFGSNIARISDFGLCCKFGENFTYHSSLTTKKFPLKWLSIEALTEHVFSEKSDVWSFGILMHEMFTFGQIPYSTMINHEEVLEFLKSGNRLSRPDSMPNDLYETELRCWLENPEERINFLALEEKFRNLIETETRSYGYLIS